MLFNTQQRRIQNPFFAQTLDYEFISNIYISTFPVPLTQWSQGFISGVI